MRTHPLPVMRKEQHVALSLHRQVGSAQEDVTLVPPTSGLPHPSASISFEQIDYRIRGRRGKICREKPREQILFNVTGAFSSGMNAILGTANRSRSKIEQRLFQDPRAVANLRCWTSWPIAKTLKGSQERFSSVVNLARSSSNTRWATLFKKVSLTVRHIPNSNSSSSFDNGFQSIELSLRLNSILKLDFEPTSSFFVCLRIVCFSCSSIHSDRNLFHSLP